MYYDTKTLEYLNNLNNALTLFDNLHPFNKNATMTEDDGYCYSLGDIPVCKDGRAIGKMVWDDFNWVWEPSEHIE